MSKNIIDMIRNAVAAETAKAPAKAAEEVTLVTELQGKVSAARATINIENALSGHFDDKTAQEFLGSYTVKRPIRMQGFGASADAAGQVYLKTGTVIDLVAVLCTKHKSCKCRKEYYLIAAIPGSHTGSVKKTHVLLEAPGANEWEIDECLVSKTVLVGNILEGIVEVAALQENRSGRYCKGDVAGPVYASRMDRDKKDERWGLPVSRQADVSTLAEAA